MVSFHQPAITSLDINPTLTQILPVNHCLGSQTCFTLFTPSYPAQHLIPKSVSDSHFSRPPCSLTSGLLGAAAPLVIEEAALLHAIDTDVLAPFATVLLALGGIEPAAVAGVVASLALDELREVTAGAHVRRGGGEDAREGEDGEDSGGLHFDG